jgi:hypothetical protein
MSLIKDFRFAKGASSAKEGSTQPSSNITMSVKACLFLIKLGLTSR